VTRNYVIWSRKEWETLADLTWVIRSNSDKKDRLIPIVTQAVEQFKPERRRAIGTDIVKVLVPMLEQRDRLAATARSEPVKQEKFVERPLPSSIDATDTAVLVGELAKRAHEYFSGRGTSLFDALISIAEGFATRPSHTEPVKEARPAYAPPAPKEVEKTIKEKQERPEKVRVVLVGGLSIQQQEIASRICDIAKIRFIDKNRTYDLGISNGSQDIIAIMTSFVDHSTVHQIKAQANGARVLELRGNASGVARDIRACILNPEARPCTHS
jgi:hypothetical protein